MKIVFLFKSENFLLPLGLCLVSAAAKAAGHQVYLCEIKESDPLGFIRSTQPDVVAYSSSTGESKHYLKLNTLIKKNFPSIFSVMGGPHPTFYPDVIFEGCLDAICVGEGEGAFVDLLEHLSLKKSLESIPNIVTPNNRHDFTLRDLIPDLDALPFPDFELIYGSTKLGAYPLKSFMTSRGCPYGCTYCFNPAWNKMYAGKGKIIRRHSVDYVIDQIRLVRSRWPLSCVKFYDDIFVYRVDDWLEDFSRKYRKEVGLPFFILTRADLVTEDVVKVLKEAGCRSISMSIEAGNPRLRNELLKRGMTDEQIVSAHLLCEKYGIYTFSNCILGLPGATTANEIESLDLALACRVTWLECPIFQPYPGTELGEHVVEQGYYLPDYQAMHTSYQHKSVLNCFSENEKKIQMNLSLLGPVAAVFPRTRNLIVNFLIHLPYNHLFTLAYYLVKMRVLPSKIYETKVSFWGAVGILARSLRQEWFKHGDEEG